MMGCLAALSLAGCGGSDSGGGSSTVPSESLISEGYNSVYLNSYNIDSEVGYVCFLRSDGACTFIPNSPHTFRFKGSWTEKFLGDGKFLITFDNLSEHGNSLNCGITFTPGPITLTITNMSAYRAAQEVTASFDKEPFTHTPGTGCNVTATKGATKLLLQMVQASSSASSESNL